MAQRELIVERFGGVTGREPIGHHEGCHGGKHAVGRRGREAKAVAEVVATGEEEGPVAGHEAVHTVGVERGHEVDGFGEAELGRRIGGARPVEREVEAALVGAGAVGAVADDEGANGLLERGCDPEEGGSFGCAEPLVAVARVVARTERFDGEWCGEGGMGAVDHHPDATGFERGGEGFDGETEPRCAGDVVEEDKAGAGGDGLKEGSLDLCRGGDREGDLCNDEAGAGAISRLLQDVAAGVVDVARGEQLVAGPEVERGNDGGHRGGGVCEQCKVVGRGADEGCKRVAGAVEQRLQVAKHEGYGLLLHEVAERLLSRHQEAGCCAVGAVIEEGPGGVEPPVRERRCRLAEHGYSTQRGGRPGVP